MLEVPITVAFDPRRVIGHVRLRKDELPPFPNWCLAIAYMVHADGRYELREFGLVSVERIINDEPK